MNEVDHCGIASLPLLACQLEFRLQHKLDELDTMSAHDLESRHGNEWSLTLEVERVTFSSIFS